MNIAEGHKIGKDNCPRCGTLLDAAAHISKTATDNPLPNPHDATVCPKCFALLEYGSDMGLIPLSEASFNNLPPHEQETLLALAIALKSYQRSQIIRN